jgi:hypothetical protein
MFPTRESLEAYEREPVITPTEMKLVRRLRELGTAAQTKLNSCKELHNNISLEFGLADMTAAVTGDRVFDSIKRDGVVVLMYRGEFAFVDSRADPKDAGRLVAKAFERGFVEYGYTKEHKVR